jgi:hypothetical protein
VIRLVFNPQHLPTLDLMGAWEDCWQAGYLALELGADTAEPLLALEWPLTPSSPEWAKRAAVWAADRFWARVDREAARNLPQGRLGANGGKS